MYAVEIVGAVATMLGILSPWRFLVHGMFYVGTGAALLWTVYDPIRWKAIPRCLDMLENKGRVAAAIGAAIEAGQIQHDTAVDEMLAYMTPEELKELMKSDRSEFWASVKKSDGEWKRKLRRGTAASASEQDTPR